MDDMDWESREHISGFEDGLLAPVITNHDPDKIQLFKWGLIPHWSKEEKIKFNTANAKSEDIENKASWRKPIRGQRCLVPATGFLTDSVPGRVKMKPHYLEKVRRPCCAASYESPLWC